MPIKFSNNLQSSIADAAGFPIGDMSFSLTAGDGAKLLARVPDLNTSGNFILARIKNVAGERETIKISSVTGDVCQIDQRAVDEEDIERNWAQDDIVHFVLTAAAMYLLDQSAAVAQNAADITQNAADIISNASAISDHQNNTSNPHSVTKDQVGLGNVTNVPVPTFVDAADGGAYVSSSPLNIVSSIAQSSWISIGPTGSGAGYEWGPLNGIASDVNWIKVKVNLSCYTTGGTPDISNSINCYARKNGSATYQLKPNQIVRLSNWINANGRSIVSGVVEATIPVVNRMFDFYWDTSFANNAVEAYLIGRGLNA